jgi:hypothetical protein
MRNLSPERFEPADAASESVARHLGIIVAAAARGFGRLESSVRRLRPTFYQVFMVKSKIYSKIIMLSRNIDAAPASAAQVFPTRKSADGARKCYIGRPDRRPTSRPTGSMWGEKLPR